jgi:phosphate transport system substrate-binding protein
MKARPGTKVTVTGGGSGVGIAALISGTTDIAMASRNMKFDEKPKSNKPVRHR